jgi:hypothetical protein
MVNIIKNATLVNPIGQKSVTLMAPTDEDTEDDDQNAFSTQQRANPTNNAGNGFYEGGGVRIGKRRSNSLGVLPDKKAKRLMEKQVNKLIMRTYKLDCSSAGPQHGTFGGRGRRNDRSTPPTTGRSNVTSTCRKSLNVGRTSA